jgi:uncharacterized protein YoxC
MKYRDIDIFILVLAALAALAIICTALIWGVQAEKQIKNVSTQLDTMWSEIEIVRTQTYDIYTECK